jgi:PAS domain S-box-containing protein
MTSNPQTNVVAAGGAESALRESHALYNSQVETLPISLFRKDLAGRFAFVNQRFAALLRTSPAQILGKTDFDFFPPHLAEAYPRAGRITKAGGCARTARASWRAASPSR